MSAGGRCAAVTGDRRYAAASLRRFAQRVLEAHGLEERHAMVTADVLVEGDLLGHSTHGVDLLPIYAGYLTEGTMTRAGEPDVIADRGSIVQLDGKRLPGQSLVVDALQMGLERASRHGLASVTIRDSQHTGCHAAYLPKAIDRGYFVLLTSTSSFGRRIAPHGGLDAAFTPSPFAVGIPTDDGPIILDMTMAATANSVVRQHYQRGDKLPHAWLLDSEGMPSHDPAVLYEEPMGTLLPLGGVVNGHKGYGLILMVEALTLGLTGVAKVADAESSTQSVYLQVADPEAFGGRSGFARAVGSIVRGVKASRPAPGTSGPRLPGERALALRRRQLRDGIELSADIQERLIEAGRASGVDFPAELES